MPRKREPKSAARARGRLERDKAGNTFIDFPCNSGEAGIRVSFLRNWYSPPHTETGEVDFETAARELGRELTGGTLVIRNFLDNGELSYAAEIPVDSKDDLERVLRTIRKVFKEGLQHDNAIRQAALEQCKAKVASKQSDIPLRLERRRESERRRGDRRTRRSSSPKSMWRPDRRILGDRRVRQERRLA